MCASVGVDPLASNKGVWAQLLGFGDFYYELGVQIVEACLATRAYNGGLIDLPALRRYVQVQINSIVTTCIWLLLEVWQQQFQPIQHHSSPAQAAMRVSLHSSQKLNTPRAVSPRICRLLRQMRMRATLT